MIKNNIFIK